MDTDLIAYVERLELMAFFAGFPLIYTLVQVIASESRKSGAFLQKLVMLLPFAYALTGSLFLGFVLKNMYPHYSFSNIGEQFQNSYLKVWGLLAVLFWIPAISKKPVYSLLHSLVLFFFLLKDLFIHMTSSIGKEVIQNDMKIYTDSLLLNTATLALVAVLYFILSKKRNNQNSAFSA